MSLRDFHMRTSALVQEAADGEVIIIQKRCVDVDELVPIETPAAELSRERERSGYVKKLRKTNSNIDRSISKDRGR